MNNFEKARHDAFEDLIEGDQELTDLYAQGMLGEEYLIQECTYELSEEILPERIY